MKGLVAGLVLKCLLRQHGVYFPVPRTVRVSNIVRHQPNFSMLNEICIFFNNKAVLGDLSIPLTIACVVWDGRADRGKHHQNILHEKSLFSKKIVSI